MVAAFSMQIVSKYVHTAASRSISLTHVQCALVFIQALHIHRYTVFNINMKFYWHKREMERKLFACLVSSWQSAEAKQRSFKGDYFNKVALEIGTLHNQLRPKTLGSPKWPWNDCRKYLRHFVWVSLGSREWDCAWCPGRDRHLAVATAPAASSSSVFRLIRWVGHDSSAACSAVSILHIDIVAGNGLCCAPTVIQFHLITATAHPTLNRLTNR